MNTPRRPLLTALLAASTLGTSTLAQHTITVDDDRLQIADAMFTDLESAVAHLHSDFNPQLQHATILLAPGRYDLVETLEMPVGGFRLTIKGIGERPRIDLGSTRIGIAVAGGELVLEGLQLESRATGDVEHPSVAVACHAGRLRIDDCVFRQMNPNRDAGTAVLASCSSVEISGSSFLRYSDAGIALKHQAIATIQDSLFRKCLDGVRITASDPRTSLVDILDCRFDRNTVGISLESTGSEGFHHDLDALLFLLQVAMSPLSATDIMQRGFVLNVMDTDFDSHEADVQDQSAEAILNWFERCTFSSWPLGSWEGLQNTIQ